MLSSSQNYIYAYGEAAVALPDNCKIIGHIKCSSHINSELRS